MRRPRPIWRRTSCLLGLLALAATPSWAAEATTLSAVERAAIQEAAQPCGRETGGAALADLGDGALWASLERYATVELGQRLRPSEIDGMWATDPPVRAVAREMQEAHAQGRLPAWIAGLPPRAPHYRALLAARCRYSAMAGNGGWPAIPAGPPLRSGMEGPAVEALRRRLTIEGYLTGPRATGPFDAPLAAAVANFQRRHDLVSDGVVGDATRQALNVTAASRLSQIEANLERWRWVPDLPADRLEVDVAAAEASLYRGGAAVLRMRVIVGDPEHRTPLFRTRLAGIVLNPPWNVPQSIAEKELLPRETARPGYLAANGFTRIGSALRQAPGPKNALGQLKFDFPSPFGVYLHDTPSRGLFAQANRSLSHGCVRLEKPRELALALLASSGWTQDALDAAIATGETRMIRLAETPQLVLVYRSAAAEPDGSVAFHRDPYGWDARLAEALGTREPPAARAAMPETECSSSGKPDRRYDDGSGKEGPA